MGFIYAIFEYNNINRLNNIEDINQAQRSSCATHPVILMIICAKYGKNSARTIYAVEQTRQDVPHFISVIGKSWLNDLKDIGQGQKVIMRDTPSHASDYLWIIPENGRTQWNQYTPPPNSFVVRGYNKLHD